MDMLSDKEIYLKVCFSVITNKMYLNIFSVLNIEKYLNKICIREAEFLKQFQFIQFTDFN